MSPFQWSSMQRIVPFSRDMTLTFRFRPGLVVASGVPKQGASITGGEMTGRLILTTMECVFKLRTCTQAPVTAPKVAARAHQIPPSGLLGFGSGALCVLLLTVHSLGERLRLPGRETGSARSPAKAHPAGAAAESQYPEYESLFQPRSRIFPAAFGQCICGAGES